MKNTLENVTLAELTTEEQIEINAGGVVREDEKQKRLFDFVWNLLTGF
ncbi:hypothetical protein [Sphingobacterium sp. MYb382]